MNTPNSRKRRAAFWNYNSGGTYFVTFCTRDRVCWLGEVISGEMILSESGEIVKDIICHLTKKYPTVQLGSFVVMPNHVHLILSISSRKKSALNGEPDKEDTEGGFLGANNPMGQKGLGEIVRYLKGRTTFEIRKGCKEFRWQANYHDHIIGKMEEHMLIKDYIESNPAKWTADRFFR